MIKLFIAGIIPIIISIIAYSLQKKEKLKKMNYWQFQVLIGIAYGISAIIATELSIKITGAGINVRDASPILAGLLFGTPAGAIAGFIGGAERYFAVAWGAGEYTQLACSTTCFVAGLSAGLIRKYLLDNKLANWFHGLVFTIVVEVYHMLMIFLTNMGDIIQAFNFVKQCTTLMVIFNACSVAITLFIVGFIARYKKSNENVEKKEISTTFEKWLFGIVIICYAIIIAFTTNFNLKVAENSASKSINKYLSNVVTIVELYGEVNDSLLKMSDANTIGENGKIIFLDSNKILLNGFDDLIGTEIDVESMAAKGKLFKMQLDGEEVYCIYERSCGYYLIGYIPAEEIYYESQISTYITNFMMVIVLALLFMTVFVILKKVVVENILEINKAFEIMTTGNFNEKVDDKSDIKEFASITQDINSTMAKLKMYTESAGSRINKDIEIARKIQYSLLPKVKIDDNRIEIGTKMRTAKEVGGDTYDYFLLNKDVMVIAIADTAGKGTLSTVFTMETKNLLRSLASNAKDLADVYNKTNEELCKQNDDGTFISVWTGVLYLKTGELKYVSAGHNPVLIKRNDKIETLQQNADLVFGVDEQALYHVYEAKLNPGDILLGYSNGVLDATNSQGEYYDKLRLEKVVSIKNEITAQILCDNISRDIFTFTGEQKQEDDIMLIAVKYNGAKEG